jgi:hypothetical protein
MEQLQKLVGHKVICLNAAGVEFKTGFLFAEAGGRFRVAEKSDRGLEGLYFGTENISKVEENLIVFGRFV